MYPRAAESSQLADQRCESLAATTGPSGWAPRPSPLEPDPGGNLIRAATWSGVPLCHLMPSVLPVSLSELIASVGMASGVGPWESVLLNLWLPDEIVILSPQSELRAVNCIFLL